MNSRLGGQIAFGNLNTGTYEGPADELPISHLKTWSVRYVLVSDERPEISSKLADAGFREKSHGQGWTLWEDPGALPRIRWSGARAGPAADAGIRWVISANSIDITLSQCMGRQLVLAFAANPGLETCVEKHCQGVVKSPDSLVKIEVPPGTRNVRLVYHNNLFLPAIAIALATLVSLALLPHGSKVISPLASLRGGLRSRGQNDNV